MQEWIKVYFPVKGRIRFNAITGDMIDAKTQNGEFFISFADMDTLVGFSPVEPKIIFQKKMNYIQDFRIIPDGKNLCTEAVQKAVDE